MRKLKCERRVWGFVSQASLLLLLKKGKTTPPQMGENKRKIAKAFNYFSASRDFSLDEVLKGGII